MINARRIKYSKIKATTIRLNHKVIEDLQEAKRKDRQSNKQKCKIIHRSLVKALKINSKTLCFELMGM